MSRSWTSLGLCCSVAMGCSSYKAAPVAGSFPVGNQPGLALPSLSSYQVNVWAKGTADYKNPDSIDYDSTGVWVGYQNVTAKDGTDTNTSTLVQYSRDGQVVLKTYPVPGHCDGLRIDRTTHRVFASSNEDGNPRLVSIDPSSGTLTNYTLPSPTPHGGGYDDLFFLDGKMFISASNPSPDASGVFSAPAIQSLTFNGNNAMTTNVLMGNDTATDMVTGMPVVLQEVDPDSFSTDLAGNLVLVNQAGMEIVTISHPGDANQKVTRTPVGSQLDDTVWIPSTHGQLLVVDGKANTIYSVTTNFTVGTIYTQTPDDSGVSSIVGTLDVSPATLAKAGFGIVSPVVIGFKKATGMIFLPDGP